MKTIVKPVKGYEGLYEVDSLGNVFSLNFNNWGKRKQLKGTLDSNGYAMYSLFKDEVPKKIRGHRIIGLNFLENPNNYPFINHINGIKNDNRLENLEWCTCKQNNFHARENGLTKIKGENHGQSKLTEKEVLEIRKIKKETNLSNAKLAKQFGTTNSNISLICNRKAWTHI